MQSNETTTSAMGGGGGEVEGCRGGESSKKCGAMKKKYIHNSLFPSTDATKYFNEYRTLAFMESVDSSWEALFAFGLPSLISKNIY